MMDPVERAERPDRSREMEYEDHEVAALARLDLSVVAIMTSARLDDRALEARRLALLDAATRAGREASRQLAALTRHAVMESRGSHSTWNVVSDAEACFTALADYCAAVRRASENLGTMAAECVERARSEEAANADAVPVRQARLRVV